MTRSSKAVRDGWSSSAGWHISSSRCADCVESPTSVFRFAFVDHTNAESVGVVAFARSDFKIGEVIPQGRGRSLRVVQVLDPETEKHLPILVVELVR